MDGDDPTSDDALDLSVAPVVNDALEHLGIPSHTFGTEVSALHPGQIWTSFRRPVLKYDLSMVAWRHGNEILADVSLGQGHKIEGRIGSSVLRLNMSLPETVDHGLQGIRLGDAIAHPLTARAEFVIEKVIVPSHGLTRLLYFKTPGEPLRDRAPTLDPSLTDV